jgi:hypothetical protein
LKTFIEDFPGFQVVIRVASKGENRNKRVNAHVVNLVVMQKRNQARNQPPPAMIAKWCSKVTLVITFEVLKP